MKITIERNILLDALNHACSVIEKRNTIPILSNVMIEAEEAHIRVCGTNMDMEIIAEIEAEIGVKGGITAHAHILHDIVRKSADGSIIELTLEEEESGRRLHVRCGRSHFKLNVLSADDFPKLSAGETTHQFSIEAAKLRHLIDKTGFASASEEKNRKYLNGIYFHTLEENGSPILRAVATDGHRLAYAQIECPENAESIPDFIIPHKTVQKIHRMTEGGTGIDIRLSANKIIVSQGTLTLTSKLIEGTFPDYSRVIPKGNEKKMEVDRKEFASMLGRVSVMSIDGEYPLRMELADNIGNFSIHSLDVGEASEEMQIAYEAEPLKLGFNPSYISDIIAQCDEEMVCFYFSDANSPTIIRDADNQSTLYVVMPMRI